MTLPGSTTDTTAHRRKRLGPTSIRGRLLAGLAIITPVVITALIVSWLFNAALWIGKPLVAWTMEGLRVAFRLDQVRNLGPAENIVAISLTALVLYMLGWLGSNVVGRRLIDFAEWLVSRIPFVDTVYNAAKRTLQALSGPPGGDSEKRQVVVLVEFPYPPLRVLGFMTNRVRDADSGRVFATVFIPTSPNPTSGYMEFVPIENIQATDLSMDQALTCILSGGASAPLEMRLSRVREEASRAAAKPD